MFFELKQAPFYNDNSNKNFNEKNSSFKNQRDSFYDILWNWEKNHKLENWNFNVEYGERIRHLVSFNENLTNFYQFVKLFQEQLVLVYIKIILFYILNIINNKILNYRYVKMIKC